MGKVDSLSRQLDWQIGVDKDNEDRVLVKKEWLRRAEETLVEENNLKNRIKEAQEKDEQVVKAVEELKRSEMKSIKDKVSQLCQDQWQCSVWFTTTPKGRR